VAQRSLYEKMLRFASPRFLRGALARSALPLATRNRQTSFRNKALSAAKISYVSRFFSAGPDPLSAKKEEKPSVLDLDKIPEVVLRPAASSAEASSMKAVLSGVIGNSLVCACKGVAFFISGSGVMLSECFHSLADISTNMLLLAGLIQARKPATATHPYGYSSLKNAYALISATSVLFLGCGVSVYHGISSLFNPHPVVGFSLTFSVLAGCMVIEGVTLMTALKQVQRLAAAANMTVMQYLNKGSETSAIAVVVEDSFALGGLAVASVGLGLTAITDNPLYDSIATCVVGGMLGVVGYYLMRRNLDALAGRAMSPERTRRLVDILLSHGSINALLDIKTLDVGQGRFKAEIAWDASEVTRRLLQERPEIVNQLESLQTHKEREQFLQDFGAAAIHSVGSLVDDLERRIREVEPHIHVDLETHDGRKAISDAVAHELNVVRAQTSAAAHKHT